MLKVGDNAPDFEAISDSNEKIRLSDEVKKHRVVLYFYPKDDTPGCTTEACTFRDNYNELLSLGGNVIGVSSDSIESHRKFKEKYRLPFTLISDPDGKIRKLYDATGLMLPPRITYVIDKNMKIIEAFNSQMRPRDHVEISINALKSKN
ncbi:peroxiredoxin [Picrophilus oshimae]|uniref:thioredoxin-dependent peroxiredoxin n=1 Tax=Picrophilus torridus (strain ATCC 700027 / DSM 9790 / JCM 10055 / NBRC 100828 / KAW 2/3) TaxID=1122961 RepID=Q6L214_PICTO|nr:peroxiredoxin [Picrophilus oshimae]AAT42988.1 hypothetical alkyl hydroperoxide reductase [Picrophilus oshimae DSM 9789]SMD30711.1 peroxiredoxin Q/BCP [Picrophilus oshimae DSM 9789]